MEEEREKKAVSRRKKYRRKRRPATFLKWLVCLVLLVLVAAGTAFAYQVCQGQKSQVPRESGQFISPESMPVMAASTVDSGQQKESTPQSVLEQMTLEEKVLQMFILTPEALTGANEVYAAGEKTKASIQQYPVGGLVYFRGNLRTPTQTKDMIYKTQLYSRERIGLPMFISVDEEGGTVTRIGGRAEFAVSAVGDMADIGAAGKPEGAYEAGKTIGGYLAQLGFNLDYAPVADVLSNPDNTVVKRRSFGSDPQVVAEFSKAFSKGLKEQGVNAALKHFPGHGGTAADTHKGYAYTDKTLEELMAVELVPFQSGIADGADFIMVAHIAAPKVTGDDTPSSLSETMIKQVLRGNLGYQGIVVTDALNMEAVTKEYSSKDAAVKAVQAGVDLLLMPENFGEAYQGILDAVKAGTIKEERINESVLRILKVKMR